MAELNTKYLGFSLSNPIVVGSSGLTGSVKEIVELAQNGAGAIVLKSIFEEQIMLEADYRMKKAEEDGLLYTEYSETLDYIDVHIKEKELGGYLEMIREVKNKIHIPVIASINAVSSLEWISFAKQIEGAGADALELNIFVMPFNFEKSCTDNEETYYNVLKKIKSVVNIPVSVKISPYFANLGSVILNLEKYGADGVVMFNRFASPDIDINAIKVTSAERLSHANEMANTLRWIAIMANRVKMSLAASTGIHDGEAVIKQLLAGATVTQVTSAIYKHGPGYISTMLNFVNDWMDDHGFNYIDQFRGRLSQASSQNPETFERVQFMKYFSEIK
ncbi:MAG TPA: dihydroorotate dehydrogenase-like protein [Bacteroidetes bacterium]|nr:dihydroorotate dehydrogenase-like protein [Bacteroidota bacterium]